MDTEKKLPKFHWSKIPAVKFQYKPSIDMLRGTEEIEINTGRRKNSNDNSILAVFDSLYVIEVCSRFFNNLLLSDMTREEWDKLTDAIWSSFNIDGDLHNLNISDFGSELEPVDVQIAETKTPTKAKAK